jgi:hypothetical protein
MDELEQALGRLVDLVARHLGEGSLESETLNQLAAGRFDCSAEFQELVTRTEPLVGTGCSLRYGLRCLMRNTGAYLGRRSAAELRSILLDRLAAKATKGIILQSLPWVNLDGLRLPLEWNGCRLMAFSGEDLKRVIGHDARTVFFPHTSLTEEEIRILSMECWLVVPTETEAAPPGSIVVHFPDEEATRFTDLPIELESALAEVMSLEWASARKPESEWWTGFGLGTRVTVSGDPFGHPARPVRGTFAYEEVDDGHVSEPIPQFDTLELGEIPSVHDKMARLANAEVGKTIRQAFLYLTKAGLCGTLGAQRVDQMVHHVLVLDALFGDGDVGSSGRLANRVVTMLGEEDRESTRKKVREVYKYRSSLVHGTPPGQIGNEVMWDARRLAQSTSRKALDVLSHYATRGSVLTRSSLLGILDALHGSQLAPQELASLVGQWPEPGA